MTGSEGLLGVVVEVTVKLLPKPVCAKVLLAAFADVESAGPRSARSSPRESCPPVWR